MIVLRRPTTLTVLPYNSISRMLPSNDMSRWDCSSGYSPARTPWIPIMDVHQLLSACFFHSFSTLMHIHYTCAVSSAYLTFSLYFMLLDKLRLKSDGINMINWKGINVYCCHNVTNVIYVTTNHINIDRYFHSVLINQSMMFLRWMSCRFFLLT